MTNHRVHVHGRGKVGQTLYQELVRGGVPTTSSSFRAGIPDTGEANVLILASRDSQLATVVDQWNALGMKTSIHTVLHVSGGISEQILKPLQNNERSIGRMHLCLAFASAQHPPRLCAGHALVTGDSHAIRVAGDLLDRVGMAWHPYPQVNTVTYHAGATLVAMGLVSSMDAAIGMLARSGVSKEASMDLMLGLARSILDNVQSLGTKAPTGVIRRAEISVLDGHLSALQEHDPLALALYQASARVVVRMIEAYGPEDSEAVQTVVNHLDTWNPTS